jgi:hypothetical protein
VHGEYEGLPGICHASLGVEMMTPDALLCVLITEFEPQMLNAHAAAVASLRGATNASTMRALRRAGAPAAAALMAGLLEPDSL